MDLPRVSTAPARLVSMAWCVLSLAVAANTALAVCTPATATHAARVMPNLVLVTATLAGLERPVRMVGVLSHATEFAVSILTSLAVSMLSSSL